MKKGIVCLLAALAASLLLPAPGSMPRPDAPQGGPAATGRRVSAENASGKSPEDTSDAVLYFRFADTRYLGTESVKLDIQREETVLTLIVQELIAGPSVTHDRLKGVFPQGTRLISASAEGSLAAIVLNDAFLGKPDGAPSDWEDSELWRQEAALRRSLAFQSIVLSLTEGGRFQRVQLFVAEDDDSVPERIPLAWFDERVTDASLHLGPCGRDSTLLLTPSAVIRMVMEAWLSNDWQEAEPFILFPEDEGEAFIGEAKERRVSLLSYSVSEGSVSPDGQSATIVLDALIRTPDGDDARIDRESVPLVRVRDNWMMPADAVRQIMIRD